MIAFESPLERAEVDGDGIVLEVGGAEPMLLLARTVVNSAGLHAPALAQRFAGRERHDPADGLLLQGQLLRPGRPLAVLASDLSRSPNRPASAFMSRSTSPDAAGSGPTRNGSTRSTTWSTRRAPTSFYAEVRTLLAGPAGRRPAPGLCGHSARSSARRTRRRRTSSSPARKSTASPGLVELFGIESPGPDRVLADRLRGRTPARPGRAR